jgi:hypothetical protein
MNFQSILRSKSNAMLRQFYAMLDNIFLGNNEGNVGILAIFVVTTAASFKNCIDGCLVLHSKSLNC